MHVSVPYFLDYFFFNSIYSKVSNIKYNNHKLYIKDKKDKIFEYIQIHGCIIRKNSESDKSSHTLPYRRL